MLSVHFASKRRNNSWYTFWQPNPQVTEPVPTSLIHKQNSVHGRRRSNATFPGATTKSSSLSTCGSRDLSAPPPRLSGVPPAPHGQEEQRWEAHRQQPQWENQYTVRILPLAKQSEIHHQFLDDAHQNDTAKKIQQNVREVRRPHSHPDQLALSQKSEKQFKMTELSNPKCSNASKFWRKQPKCPQDFRNCVLAENLLIGTSDEAM